MKNGEDFTVGELIELTRRTVKFISEDLAGGPLPIGAVRFIASEIVLFAETQIMKYQTQQLLEKKQQLDDLQSMMQSVRGMGPEV